MDSVTQGMSMGTAASAPKPEHCVGKATNEMHDTVQLNSILEWKQTFQDVISAAKYLCAGEKEASV